MSEEVEYKEVLVHVIIDTLSQTITLEVGEEFEGKGIIALEAWIEKGNKAIKVVCEDETTVWIDVPTNATIYRTYKSIAVDGPKE